VSETEDFRKNLLFEVVQSGIFYCRRYLDTYTYLFKHSQIWVLPYLEARSTKFPKIWQPPPKSRRPKGDMNQVPYRRPTVLEWPGNLTVIWSFVLRAYGLIHICVRQEWKAAVIVLKILGGTVKNLVSPATRRPEFVRFCPEVLVLRYRSTCELHVKSLTRENAVDLHREVEPLWYAWRRSGAGGGVGKSSQEHESVS
jgi:hypothetical protein